jgi:hypothetical protein
MHALGAPGGQFGSGWRGQVECTMGLEVAAPRGIGSTRAEELDGEVTRRGVDGGLLAELECPRWPWLLAGRRGVLLACLCGVGSW